MTITGNGNVVTISGNDHSRVFQIDTGVTATLSGLAITQRLVNTYGGGILSTGTLTVTHSTLSGNSVGYGPGGGISIGASYTPAGGFVFGTLRSAGASSAGTH